MNKSKDYKSLTDKEKHFLTNIAQDVAMLVSTSDKDVTASEKKKHFQKKLKQFTKKWESFNVAYKAHCKGKWLPSMGKPANPLGTIWPHVYGVKWEDSIGSNRLLNERKGIFSYLCPRDMRSLGEYTLLGIIHDKVLSHCPLIAKSILPDKLTNQIWHDLITGVDIEGQTIMPGQDPLPRVVIRKDKISGSLSYVKADIEMLSKEKQALAASGLESSGRTPPKIRDSLKASQQQKQPEAEHKETEAMNQTAEALELWVADAEEAEDQWTRAKTSKKKKYITLCNKNSLHNALTKYGSFYEPLAHDNETLAKHVKEKYDKLREYIADTNNLSSLPAEPLVIAWASDLAQTLRNIANMEHRKEPQKKDGRGSCAKAGDRKRGTPETTEPKVEPIRDQVFICYSRKDKYWLDEFQIHLKPYVRNGSVTEWSDEQIALGSKWFPKIKMALACTKVAVLLVTPNFLASDFIHEHELTPLLKEAEKGNVRIIWIPVRACSYKETPLKDYQAAIDPEKPLAKIKKADRDKTWVRICEEIKKAVGR